MPLAWRGATKVAGVGTAGLAEFGTAVEGGSLCGVVLAGLTWRVTRALLDQTTATV